VYFLPNNEILRLLLFLVLIFNLYVNKIKFRKYNYFNKKQQ